MREDARVMQGFWAILADLSAFGKLSIKLKALSCKVFTIIQQTLFRELVLSLDAFKFPTRIPIYKAFQDIKVQCKCV